MQRVDFKTIKIKVLLSKKLGFTGIFAYLHSIESEFLPSNCQTQENPVEYRLPWFFKDFEKQNNFRAKK
ncbi:hypothetical protein [Mesomycoplasma ovipneumoniae]|uniref:hypothetical protein n=1 Tax=Mesomycoplasma ovipneumoniae TaxID=29562 RepID=UPI003081054F